MIKIQPIVLASVLLAPGQQAAAQTTACFPTVPLSGVTYQAGDTVSNSVQEDVDSEVDCSPAGENGCGSDGKKTVTTTVTKYYNFECNAAPNDVWCNTDEPGGIYERAWTKKDECDETIARQFNPAPAPAPGVTGCPGAYVGGTSYEKEDLASVAVNDALTGTAYSVVYKCNNDESHLFCGSSGYEPGTGQYWTTAWTALGACTGSMAPTASPSFDTLASLGGCPGAWAAGTKYESGDRVASADGLVFECAAWPQEAHCGQAGYEPDPSGATEFWKDAWSVVGWCTGSIAPTVSPSYDPANLIPGGACPDAWVKGDSNSYEEGDLVSVVISEAPEVKAAFRCKAWPKSGYCGQFDPLFEHQGKSELGWEYAGGCVGTMGPTASPSFDSLSVAGPCDAAYDETFDEYEPGDMVSLAVSTAPERTLLFKCKPFPASAWCNDKTYAPSANYGETGDFGNMAWELLGSCAGSLAPTDAPAVYAGTCEYQQCRPGDGSSCLEADEGTNGCACVTNEDDTKTCTLSGTVCQTSAVAVWSASGPGAVTGGTGGSAYVAGDEVRIGALRYECKPWPAEGWCNMEAYQPTGESTGIWKNAWTQQADCPAAAP